VSTPRAAWDARKYVGLQRIVTRRLDLRTTLYRACHITLLKGAAVVLPPEGRVRLWECFIQGPERAIRRMLDNGIGAESVFQTNRKGAPLPERFGQ
jgi:hypothetical protein